MFHPVLWLSLAFAGDAPAVEPAHEANAVYRSLLGEGVSLDGARVSLPAPLLHDGQSAQAQQEALRKLAGSDREAAELLRDSVSAPIIVKLKDEPTKGGVIRRADLWFAVRADLDAIDSDSGSIRSADNKPVEAGNMRFTSRLMPPTELARLKIEPPNDNGPVKTRYVHLTGRLLDRIHVQMTDVVVATRSPGSWVIASRTDPRFNELQALANRWWPIVHKGSREEPGAPQPYSGGASYVKLGRLAADPKVILAEAHFAFVEPRAWFEGAPILRSKISLVARDQVRALRRELARRAGRPGGAKPPG